MRVELLPMPQVGVPNGCVLASSVTVPHESLALLARLCCAVDLEEESVLTPRDEAPRPTQDQPGAHTCNKEKEAWKLDK